MRADHRGQGSGSTEDSLFARDSLDAQLRAELVQATGAVTTFDADLLLDRTDEEVLVELLEKTTVPPVQVLWEQAWSPGPQETTVDVQHNLMYGGAGEGRPVLVPAVEVGVHIPYTGDRMMLLLRPSTFSNTFPRADVAADEIVLRVTQPGLTDEQVTAAFNGFRASVDRYLASTNADIAAHNRALEADLRRQIAERRLRLLAQRQLASSLPFQLRPAGTQATYALPVRRAKIHLTQPRPAQPFRPEPALEDAIYEDILGRIAAFGHAVERTPMTVGATNEEGLRDHLLLALNSSYEGQAAGEVFTRGGKADIVITSGDRHVFIAECKVWTGAKNFAAAVDQLLRYVVWRDGKAALVLFIKSGQATDVIAKADAAVTAHPQCARRVEPADPSRRIDYMLRSSADAQRLIRTAFVPIVIAAP